MADNSRPSRNMPGFWLLFSGRAHAEYMASDIRRATTGFLKGDVLGGLLNAPYQNWVTPGWIDYHPRPVGKPFFGLGMRSGSPLFLQITAFLFFDLPSVFGHGAAFMTFDVAGQRPAAI